MKYIAVYEVDGYSKTGTDRKGIHDQHEDTVTTHLKPDSWSPGREITGRQEMLLHTTESQSPAWGDTFLVTVEKITEKPPEGVHWSDWIKEYVERKQSEGTPLPAGRRFR